MSPPAPRFRLRQKEGTSINAGSARPPRVGESASKLYSGHFATCRPNTVMLQAVHPDQSAQQKEQQKNNCDNKTSARNKLLAPHGENSTAHSVGEAPGARLLARSRASANSAKLLHPSWCPSARKFASRYQLATKNSLYCARL